MRNNDFKNTSMVELAGIITNHLRGEGIEVVLVGGLLLPFIRKIVTSQKILICTI
jgi:hypothetical protein